MEIKLKRYVSSYPDKITEIAINTGSGDITPNELVAVKATLEMFYETTVRKSYLRSIVNEVKRLTAEKKK